jgi:hypothetical protein
LERVHVDKVESEERMRELYESGKKRQEERDRQLQLQLEEE